MTFKNCGVGASQTNEIISTGQTFPSNSKPSLFSRFSSVRNGLIYPEKMLTGSLRRGIK
jgi:hypothetical protein